MAKAITGVVVLIIIMSCLFMAVHATDNDDCRRPTPRRPAVRIAKFQLYVQVTRDGEQCPTVYDVATASITPRSPNGFGRVSVIDRPITAGPDLNSQRLGSQQGTSISSDCETPTLFLNSIFLFTSGPFNGSYFIVSGRIYSGTVTDLEDGEVAVAGGAGAFRSAKGYGYRRFYSLNAITAVNDRVLEYDFTIQVNE